MKTAIKWIAFYLVFAIFLSVCVGLILMAENSKGVIVRANVVRAKQPMFERFLDAIQQVESGGDDFAVGDGGKAVGAYQIWPIYVDDVNRIIGVEKFTLTDRWDAVKSRDMVRIYLNHYATEARLDCTPTFEDMAAMHCAGPDGYLQKDEPRVKIYIEKVKKELDNN